MIHPLKQLVVDQKSGISRGITSVCSANEFVLEASMENAQKFSEYVLIEATANQVNQFGGYTGMVPADFVIFAKGIAKKVGFDMDKLVLGGDHLGPLTWTDETEAVAMKNAKELVRQFVMAGFTKIHIDTSMKVADDDKALRLSDEVIAKRGATLCAECEKAYAALLKTNPDAIAPVYVIGSEVPIPGGTQEEEEEGLQVTKVADFKQTVAVFKSQYDALNLSEAWQRVIAVVVQPGVEFGDATIDEYDREKANDLINAMNGYPSLILEGHSTDYQTPAKLRQLVQDGIAVLKVGPALTFALREALFSLEAIEKEMFANTGTHLSNFQNVLEDIMLKNPDNWQKHYHGSMDELMSKRKYSLSDRARYYLPNPEVDCAIKRLMTNLSSQQISIALLSQYLPIQYTKVRAGELNNDPYSLAKDRIVQCMDEYAFACGRNRRNL
jgi:D-tagatose-1,6-bisphosphate aldolase subunit GatZ/KbaZ